MSCLMQGDGAFLVLCHHLGLFLQTADDAVDGREEVILADRLLVMAGSDQGCFVADVSDVGQS